MAITVEIRITMVTTVWICVLPSGRFDVTTGSFDWINFVTNDKKKGFSPCFNGMRCLTKWDLTREHDVTSNIVICLVNKKGHITSKCGASHWESIILNSGKHPSWRTKTRKPWKMIAPFNNYVLCIINTQPQFHSVPSDPTFYRL